ncbi:hypothetical protein [Pantoea vagans]|uniref:hypothetical protein n=1 Tax=Pantoea vagans TaxID=470934 RepID=UPI00289D1710|nr:hypothetical protein [Pantoea vagans]
MNITEHEMRGLLTGKCLPGDMRLNEELPAYLVRKFAEIKAQRDALAAENGLAAQAVQTFCDVVGSNTDVIAEEMGIEGAKAILAAMSATGNMPATDAYLNSVRAEGVDDLATFAGQQYQQHAGDKAQQKKWKSMVFLCTQFAAQLRAGESS